MGGVTIRRLSLLRRFRPDRRDLLGGCQDAQAGHAVSVTPQATSTDITTYNDFVQNLADAAGLGGGTWRVIGSTAAVAARDNTSTHPTTDGTGVSVFLVDGLTKIADNNVDLWNGNLDNPLNTDETGNGGLTGSVFTGSEPNGTQRSNGRVLGGSNESSGKVTIGEMQQVGGQWMVIFNAQTTSSQPVYALSAPLTVVSIDNNSFGNWIENFNVGEMDGFNDDPDGDQLANGLEAWFGIDPGEFNAGLAGLATEGSTTTFTHPLDANPPTDLSGYYQWSPNLIDWYAGDGIDGPPGGPTMSISSATIGVQIP